MLLYWFRGVKYISNNLELISSSITAMDKYIDLAGKKAEIVSAEGEYFIKYISDK